jgi:DUF2971 family protein
MPEVPAKMPVITRWLEILEGEPEQAPDAPILHHYTDAIGLHGIISSNALWATEAQFSNDLSELQYALETGLGVIEEVWRQKTNLGDWERLLCDYMKQIFGGSFPNFTQPYLVSFCEDGDLLSQWRAYSRRSGFSIAFNPLKKGNSVLVRCENGFRALLKKVIYDPALQKARLRLLAERFIKLVNSLRESPSSDEGEGLQSELLLILILEMTDWVCSVKHTAFSEEREWRLVAFPKIVDKDKSFDGVMIRPTPELLLPYMVLQPLPDERLPIVEIRCGPSRLQQESGKAVGVLLRRHGYPAIPISYSKIPLRV